MEVEEVTIIKYKAFDGTLFFKKEDAVIYNEIRPQLDALFSKKAIHIKLQDILDLYEKYGYMKVQNIVVNHCPEHYNQRVLYVVWNSDKKEPYDYEADL